MAKVVDLRSDTVTQPDAAMLRAMMGAEVGDDVFEEDPSVKLLEAKVAHLLGKEAALFVTSGTMANQLAIHLHCRPGESLICEKDAHVAIYESGAAAALSGVQCDTIPWDHSWADEAIEALYHGRDIHAATTSLLVVENTHNKKGGYCLKLQELRRITAKAEALGLKTHCDGARLWNAASALDVAVADLAQGFDTIAVCFSKGLGAPVGSALAGSRELVSAARRIRKRWGGGMRQAGYLAAGAVYALDHNRSRLAEDHKRAATLAAALRDLGAVVRYPELGTNILYFKLPGWEGESLSAHLMKKGVRMLQLGEQWLRAVTHLMISDEDVEISLAALRDLARRGRP